jgi:hypothetical protein
MSTGSFLIPPCPLPGPVLLRYRSTNAHAVSWYPHVLSLALSYYVTEEKKCSFPDGIRGSEIQNHAGSSMLLTHVWRISGYTCSVLSQNAKASTRVDHLSGMESVPWNW